MCKKLFSRFKRKPKEKDLVLISLFENEVMVKLKFDKYRDILNKDDLGMVSDLASVLVFYIRLLRDGTITIKEEYGKILRGVMSKVFTYKVVSERWKWKFHDGEMTIEEK